MVEFLPHSYIFGGLRVVHFFFIVVHVHNYSKLRLSAGCMITSSFLRTVCSSLNSSLVKLHSGAIFSAERVQHLVIFILLRRQTILHLFGWNSRQSDCNLETFGECVQCSMISGDNYPLFLYSTLVVCEGFLLS